MPSYYPYLISSLPALVFGSKPPMPAEEFLRVCGDFIPADDMSLLRQAGEVEAYTIKGAKNATLARWCDFDTALRNELVRLRAGRKKTDPARFLREDGALDSHIRHIAMTAFRNPSPLEAERMLDSGRWQALDDLLAGHYFDIDALIIYYLKLKLMQSWHNIETAQKALVLEEMLSPEQRE